MSKQATGEGGVILGGGAYWERVNRSTIFGKLMQNVAATNYQKTLRDTASRAAAAVEEVYTDLQKNADILPDMPVENRNALAKQMRGLYDVCRMCGVSCSHGTDCVTILNRAAFRGFGGASADARAVQNAVAKIRNSPQFFQSEAADIVRRAVNYGVSSAVGSSAQKAAFLKDVMQGRDTEFLKAVLAAYSGGGQSAQMQSAASAIGSRDYRSRIESKVFLQTLTLAQGDNYERMLTDALRSIAVQLERDLTQNVREHNYINADTARILRAALAELRACGVSIGASERKIEHLDWFVGGDAGKIRRLQAALNETGMVEHLTEDGVYGEETENAVDEFLKCMGKFLSDPEKMHKLEKTIDSALSALDSISSSSIQMRKINDAVRGIRRDFQRAVWKLGAEYYLRPRGYDVAAMFLEHAMESAPSNFYFSQSHWVTQKVMNSNGFKKAYSELEKRIQENPEVYAVPGKIDMNFQESGDTDLYYGIGKCAIKYTCTRQHSRVRVDFNIEDKYNFEEIRLMSGGGILGVEFHFDNLGNWANDAGLLSQADSVLSIFYTHISFAKIIRTGVVRV
ncbi:MAG: hypothetical protein IJA73_04810 [Oscillospiraceae bacterium]|nr:hypothetical protein [Oscillospiraceae bacterium]